MRLASSTMRSTCYLAAALLLGYTGHAVQAWLGSGPAFVHAQSRNSGSRSDESLSFELNSGFGPSTGLTIYNPTEHTLYVYQGITGGNSHVNCSFTLHIGRLGGPVDRQNCPVGSAF